MLLMLRACRSVLPVRSPLRLPESAENVLFPGALPLASAGVGGFPLYPHYIPTVYPLYPHYIPTISPLCPHYIPTISPLYPHYIPTISPLYPQWLLKPPLEVTVLDDKEVRRRFRASNYQSTTRRSNGDGIYLVESDFPFLRQ